MSYRVVDKATGDLIFQVIDLNEYWTVCHRCNADTPHNWGLPVDENGEYVRNDYEGEWGGVPACEDCYTWHQLWSRDVA